MNRQGPGARPAHHQEHETMILKLEIMANETMLAPFDPPRYTWVNSEHVVHWYANGEHTTIQLTNHGRYHVTVAPDELAALIDLDNCCPEGGPARCGYHQYIAAGDGRTASMPHAVYHTAREEAERHAAGCKTDRVCSTCTYHEQRLRA